MITEDQLEQLSLDWFRGCGWEYANCVDISPDGDDPERDDYRVVVLKDRLAEAVARLNPDLPQSAVDDVVHVVSNPDHPSLEQNNRAPHRLSTNGVKVEYSTDDGKETIYAQIIDFQNPAGNDLLVGSQFSDSLIKKIAGYHQFHGVREAVRATTIVAVDSGGDVVRECRATYCDEVQSGLVKGSPSTPLILSRIKAKVVPDGLEPSIVCL